MENLALLLGGDGPQAPGTGWDYGNLVTAYWKAIEKHFHEGVKLLINKEARLLHELSTEGLNGLETYLHSPRLGYDGEPLSLLFLELGVDPFQRRLSDQRSGFELGFVSRRKVNMELLDACLSRLPKILHSSSLGFRELRLATEIEKPDLWKRLESLMQQISDETDLDGWTIHHFLHQADPRVHLSGYKEEMLSKTKTPSALVWPSMWQPANAKIDISADGLEAYFEAANEDSGSDDDTDDENKICLRSDYPFPPRKLGRSYFEMTVEKKELQESDDPAPTITIGLCGEFCNQFHAHPGWNVWSVGYHGDDSGIYEQDPKWKYQADRTYGPGNIVGCGVDYDAGEYFFTLDGEVVFRKSEALIYRKLYPCIGHSEGPCKVRVNFGAADFVWAGAAKLYQADEATTLPPKPRRQKTDLSQSQTR
ncbi:hypothetical protein F5Y13DRAFT_159692 [Hypoxylon sp. FL1857]|nr:hypothetical protein F5Y13DRAFT_159692 [Hypoxylon sp. FL1857]